MMTPAQLMAYEFKSAGRNAYKADDVDAFFGEVAVNYERLYRENAELSKRMGLLADKLEQYADYIIDGSGDMPTVTNNDIVEFLRANHDSGVGIFGYEMQTADYNAIRSSLDAHKTAEKFSVDKIGWEMKFRLENIGKILSYVTIGILAGVFVLLMIWIAVILKNSKKAIRGYMGNIFTFSGLVVLAAAIAVSAGAAVILSKKRK